MWAVFLASTYTALPSLSPSPPELILRPPQPGECKPRHNSYELTLSVLVLVGIIVSYLPQIAVFIVCIFQHFRIIHKRSSDGFSPWFLLMGCLSTCWSFFNILILQWRGIRCCTVISTGLCLESTLGVAQLFVQFVLFTLIFVLYMIYFPPQKKVYTLIHSLHLICLPSRSFSWAISIFFAKIILGNFVVTTVITIFLLALVNDSVGHPGPATLFWAGFLGVTSVLLAMIQHLPQIVETYFRKSVGALSIPMMLMQTPGAIMLTVSLALSPGANWSTWFPYAVSALLQIILLGMCLFYYIKAKRLGHSSFHTAETTHLLAVQQTGTKTRYGADDEDHGQVTGRPGSSSIAHFASAVESEFSHSERQQKPRRDDQSRPVSTRLGPIMGTD